MADSGTDALLLGDPGGGDFVATPVRIREVGELNGPDIYRTTTVTREMNTIRGAVRQGDSGGPIIDLDGKALRVAFGAAVDDPDTGFVLTRGRSLHSWRRSGTLCRWRVRLGRRWLARHARWGRGFCRVHRLAIATLTRVRAVIFSEFGVRPEVREAPDPEPAPDGVVIEVEATGVCRSDRHSWQGHDPGVALPHVAGHELADRIAALGVLVSGWQVGDRGTVPFVCACGSCAECASGNQQICDRQFQPGATHWGSFAEFVAVDYAETNLVALPQDLSSVHAAALGCQFATAFRALLRQGNVRTGQWVAVYGCGGAGISAVMLAVAAGAQVSR